MGSATLYLKALWQYFQILGTKCVSTQPMISKTAEDHTKTPSQFLSVDSFSESQDSS